MVKVAGSVRDLRERQFKNARAPIWVKVSGSVTEVKLRQSSNKLSPIVWHPTGTSAVWTSLLSPLIRTSVLGIRSDADSAIARCGLLLHSFTANDKVMWSKVSELL